MYKRKNSFDRQVAQGPLGGSFNPTVKFSVFASAATITVAAFLVYFPALSGGFVLDDDKLLTDSRLIKSPDGLYRFWCTAEAQDYWPVTNTSFWLEWRLWGMHPTPYHVANLILHIAESLLIWIILRRMSIPGAFLAALLFAVHPVNVESVAWIAQRKNVLAMLFFLLSILFYLKTEIQSPSGNLEKHEKPQPANADGSPLAAEHSPLAPRHWSLWYWLSLAAFLLAMLSKGSVAMLPLLILGIIWWLRPLTRWDLLRSVPFFAVAVMLTAVNLWFQRHGSDVVFRSAGFLERLLGAGSVIWFYLYKAVLPVDLAFVYPKWNIQAGNPLWWLPLLAAVAVTAILWRYRKGWSRPLLFAWGFFCVSLAPVLGFTDVGFMKYSLVADHYQHIAIIAATALTAAAWNTWRRRIQATIRPATTVVAVASLAALGFLTWQQSGIYYDGLTLYQATLQKNPDCSLAHNNLGLALAMRAGEAIEYLERHSHESALPIGIRQALKINPYYADAYNSLGIAWPTGRKAIRCQLDQYHKALRIKPDFAEVHNNLGNVLRDTGHKQDAIEQYELAVRLKPDYADAHNNLGVALAETGGFKRRLIITNRPCG